MRLLKLNVGLLISDVVQLYYDDPSNADNPRLVESIPARSDCEEGPILFDLLMKDGFAKSSLNAYIAETLSQQTTLTQVQYLRSRLLSEQGATLVNETLTDFFHSEAAKDVIHDALRIYLQKEYPQEVVSQALDGLDIKWENQPRSNNSPLGPNIARRGAHQQRVILLPHRRTLPLSRQKGRPNCERPPEGHARERKRIS